MKAKTTRQLMTDQQKLIDTLETRVKDLERTLTQVHQDTTRISRKVLRHQKIARLFDEHEAIRLLDGIEKRLSDTSKKIQVEVLKGVVFSEVGRVYPDLLPSIVKLMDFGDDWWRAGDNLTIGEWADRISLGEDRFSDVNVNRERSAWRTLLN